MGRCVTGVAALVTIVISFRPLSPVNQHVPFQIGRSVGRVAALGAIVTFLFIVMKLVHFELSSHHEISLFGGCSVYQCFRMSDESSFILREAFVKVKVAKLISSQMILA